MLSAESEIPAEAFEERSPRKSRKRVWNPKNKSKHSRNLGLEYMDCKGKLVPARSLKPSCQGNCRFKCKDIDLERRKSIFQKYWGLGDINAQRSFIAKHIIAIDPKYRRVRSDKSRRLNNGYYFEVQGKKLRVCKQFFTSTLDVGDKMIWNVIKKLYDGFVEPDMRGKHTNHKVLDPAIKQGIFNHINSIPRIEAHYLRQQSAREYISGSKTIADLHRDYVTDCREQNI